MPAAHAHCVPVFSCYRCLLFVLVGVVEAASLEVDGDRGIHLVDVLSLALRALRQRVGGDGTLNGEVITAILATIMIGGHCTSFADGHNDRGARHARAMPNVPCMNGKGSADGCRRLVLLFILATGQTVGGHFAQRAAKRRIPCDVSTASMRTS